MRYGLAILVEAVVEHGDDVRVPQRGEQLELAGQHGSTLCIGVRARGVPRHDELFDGDDTTAQPVQRAAHDAHASPADLVDQLVARADPETGAAAQVRSGRIRRIPGNRSDFTRVAADRGFRSVRSRRAFRRTTLVGQPTLPGVCAGGHRLLRIRTDGSARRNPSRNAEERLHQATRPLDPLVSRRSAPSGSPRRS